MDYLKALIALLWVLVHAPASANYPAAVAKDGWCYSLSQTARQCSGPSFDGAQAAAEYYCQTAVYFNPTAYSSVKAVDLSYNPVGNAPGLNGFGQFTVYFTCSAKNAYGEPVTSVRGPGTHIIQGLPYCSGGGSPINNYAPATCTGQPYNPPVACANTPGVVISAFHMVPVANPGCYAGCQYNAANTIIVNYNGSDYESGSWTGLGTVCTAGDVALTGGVPGNSQNVGNMPGLQPSDLSALATEQTLQQLVQLIQAGDTASSTLANANKTLLEQIASSTATMAAGNAQPTAVPDPDGLEALYLDKLASTQVDANGKLQTNETTVDVGGTFSNVTGFIGSNACPVPPSFSVKGHTYSFDMTIICSLAQALSYLVVVLASLAGVRIFTGGM